MPALYRVFPYLESARTREPGSAFYVPPQGGGRLDNPAMYSVFYASSAAAGAIAEAFGRLPEWTPAVLEGSPALRGSTRALARFELPDDDPICDLDDPSTLIRLRLRPSDVVSRDYDGTRAWAQRIFEQGNWIGVRCWSYYDPRWASFGLWDIRRLRLEEVAALQMSDPALLEASRTIARRIVP